MGSQPVAWSRGLVALVTTWLGSVGFLLRGEGPDVRLSWLVPLLVLAVSVVAPPRRIAAQRKVRSKPAPLFRETPGVGCALTVW